MPCNWKCYSEADFIVQGCLLVSSNKKVPQPVIPLYAFDCGRNSSFVILFTLLLSQPHHTIAPFFVHFIIIIYFFCIVVSIYLNMDHMNYFIYYLWWISLLPETGRSFTHSTSHCLSPQCVNSLWEWKAGQYPELRFLLHLGGMLTMQPGKDDWTFRQGVESREVGLLEQMIRTSGFKRISGAPKK